MLKRGWRKNFRYNWVAWAASTIVIMLIAASLAYLRYYQANHNAERYKAANAYTNATEYDSEGLCGGPDNLRAISCLVKQIRDEQEQQYAAYDLKAQQDMAEWAFGVLAATVISIFLIALTLYETLSASRELRRQNALSLNAAKAEFEPHIARHNIRNFRIVEQAARIQDNILIVALFEFDVLNVGKTSAYYVGRNSAATLYYPRSETTERTHRSWLEEKSTHSRGLIAHEILPQQHETVPFRYEFSVPKAQLDKGYGIEKMRFEFGIRVGFIDRFTTDRRLRRVVSFVFEAQGDNVEMKGSFESVGDGRDDPDAWNKVDRLIPHAFYGLEVLNKIPTPKERD
ncbi:hypothetical protein [Henriciella litoralis]|uniref:hypothetical protein n=1 Tax=Henriciella litoralis TaxID=568102 RepID=UPI000A077CE8|nr:hypothetical protein [Henriciella litoralis]